MYKLDLSGVAGDLAQEIIACAIKLSGGDKLLFISLLENKTLMNYTLRKLSRLGHSQILCVDDFNYPKYTGTRIPVAVGIMMA